MNNTSSGSLGIVYRLISFLKVPDLLFAATRKNISRALLFHGVYREPLPRELVYADLSEGQFENIIAWLSRHFTFLTPEEFLQGKKGILVTFDDGFLNNLTRALPVLEKYKVPTVFFISTQHIADARHYLFFVSNREKIARERGVQVTELQACEVFEGLGTEGLKKLAEHPLVTIGCHTVSHPLLSTLGREEVYTELAESKKYLEMLTGKPVSLLAYPLGDYSATVIEESQKLFSHAFAVVPRKYGQKDFEIPRTGIYSADTSYLKLKLALDLR